MTDLKAAVERAAYRVALNSLPADMDAHTQLAHDFLALHDLAGRLAKALRSAHDCLALLSETGHPQSDPDTPCVLPEAPILDTLRAARAKAREAGIE